MAPVSVAQWQAALGLAHPSQFQPIASLDRPMPCQETDSARTGQALPSPHSPMPPLSTRIHCRLESKSAIGRTPIPITPTRVRCMCLWSVEREYCVRREGIASLLFLFHPRSCSVFHVQYCWLAACLLLPALATMVVPTTLLPTVHYPYPTYCSAMTPP